VTGPAIDAAAVAADLHLLPGLVNGRYQVQVDRPGDARRDIDLDVLAVRVVRQLTEVRGNGLDFGPPNSDTGKRAVVLPTVIIPDLAWHLARFTASQDDALLFTGPTGVPLWHSSFRHRYWLPALAKAELAGIHLHDLCHTGNHLAATSGATLRELMDRMGHSSSRAALIYMHGSDERQQ
jgi:hypothetical protein